MMYSLVVELDGIHYFSDIVMENERSRPVGKCLVSVDNDEIFTAEIVRK